MKILLFILLSATASAQTLTDILNSARKHPLEYDSSKQEECDRWAERMSRGLIHQGAAGHYHGEVVAQACDNCGGIIQNFFKSASHKKTLLDKNAKRVCIALRVTETDPLNGNSYVVVIRTYE